MIRQAVILAGGQGQRLRSYSGSTPKPIARVLGKPFLAHLTRLVRSYGIRQVTLLIGYEAQQIIDAQEQFSLSGLDIQFVVSDPELGTAERLTASMDALEPEFLLMYSDNYFQFDVQRLEEVFRSNDSAITLNCIPREGGNVSISDGNQARYWPRSSGSRGDHVELGFALVNRDLCAQFLSVSAELPGVLEAIGADRQLTAMTSGLRYWSISDPDRLRLTEDFLRPKPIVILDRDGVINERAGRGQYVASIGDFRWRSQSLPHLEQLAACGVKFVVASNQAGIARGMVTEEAVTSVNDYLVESLAARGISINEVCTCPHGFDDGCPCRKPRPGMLLELATRWNLPLIDTFFVGDDPRDIEAAFRAGSNAAYVGTEGVQHDNFVFGERGLMLIASSSADAEDEVWKSLADEVGARTGEPQ